MLVGNRADEGLTRSTISTFAPIEISHHGSEKILPLWLLGPGILGFTEDGGSYRPGRPPLTRYEDNNVAIAPVRPYYYDVRWVEH